MLITRDEQGLGSDNGSDHSENLEVHDEELKGKNFEGKMDQCFFPEETSQAQTFYQGTFLRTSTVIDEIYDGVDSHQTSEAIQTQESFKNPREESNLVNLFPIGS